MIFSEELKNLIRALTGLPGIGPRQATRLSFFLVNSNRQQLRVLSAALAGASRLSTCPNCFFVSAGGADSLCHICSDPSRDASVLAIVAKETDLLSLEKTGRFRGRYFVLGDLNRQGHLDAAHENRLRLLEERLRAGGGSVKEIILAFSPNSLGDASADILSRRLAPYVLRLTRLGRGLPVGGEVEFADESTLAHALDNRS